MDEHADAGIDLEDLTYGPESYDAVDDHRPGRRRSPATTAAPHAAEIVNVTKGGEKCSTYADCLALVEAGTDIDYDGVSGPHRHVRQRRADRRLLRRARVYGDDNRIDDEPTDVQDGRGAAEEFDDMPD